MKYGEFICPRCGQVFKKKDGIETSLLVKENEKNAMVANYIKIESYYKTLFFCVDCSRQMRKNRIIYYTLFYSIPSIIIALISYSKYHDFLRCIFAALVTSIVLYVFVYPFEAIAHRKYDMKRNRMYVNRSN